MTLILENIHKTYGKRNIVNRVNIRVAPGEIVGLLGPNGAGKTTTFYIATGLIKPDKGKVWLYQQEVTSLPLHKRARLGIGYMTQQPSIFRYLTVQENIQVALEQTNITFKQRTQRLHGLLKEFRLEKNCSYERISNIRRREAENRIGTFLSYGKERPRFSTIR